MACGWLIRRFIDPKARFSFVPAKGYRPKEGELRFDMFEGEFTHEGDNCSFETILARFGIEDPALQAIAEIIHDIDLKDAKFRREEASRWETKRTPPGSPELLRRSTISTNTSGGKAADDAPCPAAPSLCPGSSEDPRASEGRL
jgi:hypothetical protein